MMTDMKNTVNCLRRQIYSDSTGSHILCKSIPIPLELPLKDFVAHPEVYTKRQVTVNDCEACLGKKLPGFHEQMASIVCPRRRIHNTENGTTIYCNPMPIPEGISKKDLLVNQRLYKRRVVTVEDCEDCLNKSLPSLRKRLLNYATEVYGWTKAGAKKRPDEEVERVWNICKQCNELQDGVCQACGCLVSKDGKPLRNKLKMDTTHCIKGLW